MIAVHTAAGALDEWITQAAYQRLGEGSSPEFGRTLALLLAVKRRHGEFFAADAADRLAASPRAGRLARRRLPRAAWAARLRRRIAGVPRPPPEQRASCVRPRGDRRPRRRPARTRRARPDNNSGPQGQEGGGPVSVDLGNARILLTGGTGFVGQAILERLLSSHPGTTILVLARPRAALSAQKRVENLLRKPVFAHWLDAVGEDEAQRQFAERVQVVEGDLGRARTRAGAARPGAAQRVVGELRRPDRRRLRHQCHRRVQALPGPGGRRRRSARRPRLHGLRQRGPPRPGDRGPGRARRRLGGRRSKPHGRRG